MFVTYLSAADTGTAGMGAGGHDQLVGAAVGALITGAVAVALWLLSRRQGVTDAARRREEFLDDRTEAARVDDLRWQRQERRALYARYISASHDAAAAADARRQDPSPENLTATAAALDAMYAIRVELDLLAGPEVSESAQVLLLATIDAAGPAGDSSGLGALQRRLVDTMRAELGVAST